MGNKETIIEIKKFLDKEKIDNPKSMKFLDVPVLEFLSELNADQTLKLIQVIANDYESKLYTLTKSNNFVDEILRKGCCIK